jgi:elongator complex protein 3
VESFINIDYTPVMYEVHTPTKEEFLELLEPVRNIVADLKKRDDLTGMAMTRILHRHPRPGGGHLKKWMVRVAYEELCSQGLLEVDPEIQQKLRVKKVRSLSGVAPVTVLTKPHPCPGKCIFCPTDVRMPKSYLPDEPGAMRALQRDYDPFLQVRDRIIAFDRNGHNTDKIELLVLGGTWSSYPKDYQEWFLKRCFDAMNGVDSETLVEAQELNVNAKHRNVGMVLETRPDHITPKEIRWLRYLGATKIQMGAQSLDEKILADNKRGHTVERTRLAVRMLRAAAFKIVLHWMPNLLGATLESDLEDGKQLWSDNSFRPDETKIYPCSLLENAELYEYWKRGEWLPYSEEDLIELVGQAKLQTPNYCRINRVFRDIPAPNIVTGVDRANLRQMVQQDLAAKGQGCSCVRCREVRGYVPTIDELKLKSLPYDTWGSKEFFLSFETEDSKLAGYLRLSLPKTPGRSGDQDLEIPELNEAALVREIHVYGRATGLGKSEERSTQHQGIGKRLLERSEELASEAGYSKMAIIASIGTRGYYAKRGYHLEGTYMVKAL